MNTTAEGGLVRIATISDIHGNIHALKAVLDDIDQQEIDQLYCLGDLVGYGAYPNEVIELVRQRHIPTVMGNYDDGVGFDKDECGCAYTDAEMRRLGLLSVAWTKKQVTVENKAYLRWLLSDIRLNFHQLRFRLVHGSPRRINEYVYEDRAAKSLSRIAQAADADVLVMGHTHLPYVKEVDGVLFVNDGSVGKPKDGDSRAAYAIYDIGDELNVTIQRVAYDVQAAAEAVRASALPDHFAELLEEASG
jgi:putative phosphoesterase